MKAPGSDGLHPYFYQQYLRNIQPSIISFWQEVFRTKSIPSEVNKTYLCLIPKVKHPTMITQYRPIGLCNILYKIITKNIVHKIKPLLQKIVSPKQSAFLTKRRASDNAIIVQEIINSF